LEPVSPVAAPVMVRDFSETVESSDDERDVIGFMIQTEEKEHYASPEPAVEEEAKNGAVDFVEEVVAPEEEEHLLEPGAVASALMVKEVADALKAPPEEDNMSPVFDKESDQEITEYQDIEGKSLVEQLKEIIVFAGPALGIWLSGPIMGIIDTAVIGNSSSLELAALGEYKPKCFNPTDLAKTLEFRILIAFGKSIANAAICQIYQCGCEFWKIDEKMQFFLVLH
jgi:hypothetical protein